MKNKRNILKRLGVWALIVVSILLIPLLANFPWTLRDYIFAGTVLFTASLIYEILTRNTNDSRKHAMIGLAVTAIIFLIWGWAVA